MYKFVVIGDELFVQTCLQQANANPSVQILAVATTAAQGVEVLRDTVQADVVLIGLPEQEALNFASKMSKIHKNRLFFIATQKYTMELWRAAQKEGIRLVNVANMIQQIVSVLVTMGYKKVVSEMNQELNILTPGDIWEEQGRKEVENQLKKEPNIKREIIKQHILAFYSPKGGAGKTTLSVNTAVLLASTTNLRVVLVDFDVEFGDASTVLGFPRPEKTMSAWVDLPPDCDKNTVESYLHKHKSGLWLLPAPQRSADEAHIDGATANRILTILSRYFDVIVCDMAISTAKDTTRVVLDRATKVCLIGTSDPATVAQVRRWVSDTMDMIKLDSSKVRFVVNRLSKLTQYKPEEIAEVVNLPLYGKVPDDPIVAKAVASGNLPILADSKSLFYQSISHLAEIMIGAKFKQEKTSFWDKIKAMFTKKK